MPYIMHISVDGACRRNGRDGAVGAAAIVIEPKWGKSRSWTRILPDNPAPTSQRAELTAIILALEQALERYDELRGYPYMDVTIYTDSKYALGCMTEWIHKWSSNGWRNAAGYEVANRDLIEEAWDLHKRLDNKGGVEYCWVPRQDNQEADAAVNEALDEYEQQSSEEDSEDDDWYY